MGAPEDTVTAPAGSTLDRGVGDRGVQDTGIFPANPDREEVSALEENDDYPGCDKIPYFEPSESLSDEEIRRLDKLTSLYGLPGLDGTPCIFKSARSIYNNLSAVARKPKIYADMLWRLLDMRKTLGERTKPYKLMFDTRLRNPLPKEVLEYWPFSDHARWAEDYKALKKGHASLDMPIVLVEKKQDIKVDDSQQAALDATMLEAERLVNEAAISAAGGLENTPEVKRALGYLTTVTLKHIEKQTGVQFHSPYDEVKLIKSTEFLVYHGPFSVVLDMQGNPTTLNGLLRFPILIPDPGSVMERSLPVPGVYVSVQKYGFGDFQLDGKKIRKILFGGIGGLVENYGIGVRRPHEFNQRLQGHLEMMGYAFASSLIAKSAFSPKELTVSAIKNQFSDVVEMTMPYAVTEIAKRAKHDFENWEEIAKEIGKEVLKAIIIEKVKDKIKMWLIKKIGTKIIPLVNAVSAIYDLFAGEEERRQVRNAVGCIMMYVQGSTDDDHHIAAKTLAKIMTDIFHDAIMSAIIKKAAEKGGKLSFRKHDPDAGGGKGHAKPSDDDASAKTDPSAKHQDAPADTPADTTAAKPADTATRTDSPQGTDRRATDDPATDGSGTAVPTIQNRGNDQTGTPPRPDANQGTGSQGGEHGESKGETKGDPKGDTKGETKTDPEATQKGDDTDVETKPAKPAKMPSKEKDAEGGDDEESVKPMSGKRKKDTGREGDQEEEAPKAPRPKQGKQGEEGDEEEGQAPPPPPNAAKKPKADDAGDPQARGTGDADNQGTANSATANNATANNSTTSSPAHPAAKPKKPKVRSRDKLDRMLDWYNAVRQRWGGGFKIIMKAIRERDKLRKAWAYVKSGFFAHHLVPVVVLRQHPVAQAAVVGGFDFNGKKNGALLNHQEHAGGHDEYNERIMQEMDHFAEQNPGYTPQQARDFVESRIPAWKKDYLEGGDYIEDTSDPGTAKR